MAARKSTAFTLIELLIVVAIIILLVSILAPAVSRVLEHSFRAACAGNVKEIGRAAMNYALAPRLHRGAKGKSFPDTDPTSGNWHTAGGNRGCLWVLVKHGFIAPESFICPSLDGFQAAVSNASGFGNSNCAYSFISMVEQVRTLNNSYTSLAIVADLNPRFDPGSSTLYEYSDFDHDGGTSSTEQDRANELQSEGKLKNAAAHGYDGQNVGLLDGSVRFLRKPVVRTNTNREDWIYESTTPGSDTDGKCRSADDVLLLD